MPEIASSEYEIVLFYNPKSNLARSTYAYAKGEGLPLRDVDITKDMPTGTQLEEIADRLNTNIEGLLNREHPEFEKLYEDSSFEDEDWIKILHKNPEFLKEPIAIRGHQAIFVKTPSELSRL